MKKCSKCGVNAGLLALRVGVGAIFIFAGWMKVSDLSGTVGFFATMGFSPFWAYVASFTELIAGVAVLLGIFTRCAAALLAIVMLVAGYKLLATPQMLMTPVSLLFSSIALILAGGGAYSLGRKCCGSGPCCEGGNCEDHATGAGTAPEVK